MAEHGTTARYFNHNNPCRCDECRSAALAYQRARRDANKDVVDKNRIHQKIYARNRLEDNRLYIEKLKANPCKDCGNTFPPECMDFDHVKGIKKFNLSKFHNKSKSLITAEVAKCELVCANCHRIRTKQRRLLVPNTTAILRR